MKVAIDTGSSFLYVLSDSVKAKCQDQTCAQASTWSPSPGQQGLVFQGSFSQEYNGFTATSNNYKGTITLGSQIINDLTFGVVTSLVGSRSMGLLGLGYTRDANRPTVLEVLYRTKKVINLAGYSFWFDDTSAQTGSLLLGGIDTAKYSDLLTLPAKSGRDFVVNLDAMALNSHDGKASGFDRRGPLKVLMDTGSVETVLPDDFVKRLQEKYDLQTLDQSGSLWVECARSQSTEIVDFSFSNKGKTLKIPVPISRFIAPTWAGYRAPTSQKGTPLCQFGIRPMSGYWERDTQRDPNTGVLGQTFLQNAYIVNDITNNQVSIGLPKYSGSSNILPIPKGGVTQMRQVSELGDNGASQAFDGENSNATENQLAAAAASSNSSPIPQAQPSDISNVQASQLTKDANNQIGENQIPSLSAQVTGNDLFDTNAEVYER